MRARSRPGPTSLLRQALAYSLPTWAGRAFSVLAAPILTRLLDTGDYGVVDLLAAIQAAILVVAPLGVESGFRRYYTASSDAEERRALLGSAYAAWALLGGTGCMLLLAGAEQVAAGALGGAGSAALVRVAALSMAGQIAYRMVLEILRDNFRTRAVTLLGLGAVVLRLVLTLGFIAGLRTGVVGFYYASLGASAPLAAVGAWVAWPLLRASFSWRHLRRVAAFGLPLVPDRLGAYAVAYADRYFVGALVGMSGLGLYAVGNKVAALLNLATAGFMAAWGPYALRSWRDPGAQPRFRRVFRLYASALVAAATVLSVFAPEILGVFAPPSYAGAARVVPVLVFAVVLGHLARVFSVGIELAERTGLRAAISLGVLALNLLLNALWIPRVGILGAALATLASYAAACVAALWISERLRPMGYAVGRFAVLLVLGAGAATAGYAAEAVLSSAARAASKLVLAGLAVALPWVCGLVAASDVGAAWRALRPAREPAA